MPFSVTAYANQPPTETAVILAAIEDLKAQQREIDARISELEATVLSDEAAPLVVTVKSTSAQLQPVILETDTIDRLSISGDARLRYEINSGVAGADDRGRMALRARLRASYQAFDWLKFGGMIATGNADDPNSNDVTLGNFSDSIPISLEQIYAQARAGRFVALAGRFSNPLLKTDLVWDGDVSPQGAAISYDAALSNSVRLKATAIYFAITEDALSDDSRMLGGQGIVSVKAGNDFDLQLAGGYYNYGLASLSGVDAGDFRSNLLTPSGFYLSDFDLLNFTAVTTYRSSGEWPLRFTADYVKNLGARTPKDTGYSLEVMAGTLKQPGDVRFGYGYSSAEVDAVFAAFSNDNIDLATNYLLHTAMLDYFVQSGLTLNVTAYHYREKDAGLANVLTEGDWVQRVRFNVVFDF